MASSVDDLNRFPEGSRPQAGSPQDPRVEALEDQVGHQASLLKAVAFGMDRFLRNERWETAAGNLLADLGTSVNADRIGLYRWFPDSHQIALSHAWSNGMGDPAASYDLERLTLSRWQDVLDRGLMQLISTDEGLGPETRLLTSEGVARSLFVPVVQGEQVWGALRLDSAGSAPDWTEGDLAVIRGASTLIGASIQKEASERRAREADERYRTLVEQVPAVVYHCEAGEDGAWLYVSPHMQGVLGLSADAWLTEPNPLRTYLHIDDRERVIGEKARIFTEGRSFVSEYRLVAPDGRTIWIVDRFSAFGDDYGMPKWLHGVMTDVTEVREAREALAAAEIAEAELRSSLAAERSAADRLRALDDMKSAFLTAISHELRTPVQVILGAASTLANADRLELSLEDRSRFVSSIDVKARRLAELLRDLVDVDRLNRGIVRFDPRTTRIDELIEAVVADVDLLADHVLHTELEPASAPVDRALMERVLENLLANAARHTPSGTDVWVRLRTEPGGVLIVVEDAGPGVAPDKRELIFSPFGQGDVQAHAPGLGVGLSLVARFVDLHRGRVWVEDRPGGGASFRVLLPIDQSEELAV